MVRYRYLAGFIFFTCLALTFVGLSPLTTAAQPTAAEGMKLISAGGYHTCALTPWQGVMCWGGNITGQLGDGTNTNSSKPVLTNISPYSGAIAISAGYSHTCAIFRMSGLPATEGGVRCWGWNFYGQLGNGNTQNSNLPVDVSGLSTGGVTAISVGESHSCAVTTGGGVQCWGYNNYGQLGDATHAPFRTLPVNVHGLASGVAAVSAGGYHTCALNLGGVVECWGMNQYGQLGNNSVITSTVPMTVSLISPPAIAIATGRYHSCALTSDGMIECWGINDNGQLGDGSKLPSPTPVLVSGLPPGGAIAITAGNGHTCAITTGGGVLCWGFNLYGQVGNGTHNDQLTPVGVSGMGSNVLAVDGGQWHTCALVANASPPPDWTAKCWGGSGQGQLGDSTTISSTLPVDVTWFPGSPLFVPFIQK